MIVPFIATLFCIAVASSISTDTSLSEFNTCIFNILPDKNYTHLEIDTAVKECFELIEDVHHESANDEGEAKNDTPLPLPEVENNGSYDTNDIDNLEEVSDPERPCTTEIKQWLENLREYFVDWRDKMKYEEKYSMLEQENTLFQLRFASKMNELVGTQDGMKEIIAISESVVSLLRDNENTIYYVALTSLKEECYELSSHLNSISIMSWRTFSIGQIS